MDSPRSGSLKVLTGQLLTKEKKPCCLQQPSQRHRHLMTEWSLTGCSQIRKSRLQCMKCGPASFWLRLLVRRWLEKRNAFLSSSGQRTEQSPCDTKSRIRSRMLLLLKEQSYNWEERSRLMEKGQVLSWNSHSSSRLKKQVHSIIPLNLSIS